MSSEKGDSILHYGSTVYIVFRTPGLRKSEIREATVVSVKKGELTGNPLCGLLVKPSKKNYPGELAQRCADRIYRTKAEAKKELFRQQLKYG